MPLIIFKGLKNVPKGTYPSGCVVTVAKGGSMTAELLQKEWSEKVWRGRPGSIFRNPAVLAMDKHRSHTHASIVTHFKRNHKTELPLLTLDCDSNLHGALEIKPSPRPS